MRAAVAKSRSMAMGFKAKKVWRYCFTLTPCLLSLR